VYTDFIRRVKYCIRLWTCNRRSNLDCLKPKKSLESSRVSEYIEKIAHKWLPFKLALKLVNLINGEFLFPPPRTRESEIELKRRFSECHCKHWINHFCITISTVQSPFYNWPSSSRLRCSSINKFTTNYELKAPFVRLK
jgi:hypothetical protein